MLILKLLDGKSFVTDLIQGYRLEGQVSLVFKYQTSKPFLTFLKELALVEVKHYMKILLTAVEHLAEHGVMHRDIKPNNFLYDPATRTGLLIDFGLSEITINCETGRPLKLQDNEQVKKIVALQKHVKIKNRVGTKGYMPPESLFNYRNQTPAVDVWACGVIFLSFLA
jgi:cell division control protein 7